MNEFLKYLKMIPVIIYPYIYVLILAIFYCSQVFCRKITLMSH